MSRKKVFPLLLTATAAITSVSATWNGLGNAANANPPQVEALPLGEESWAFVTRTHELTSARYDAISGLLTVDTNSLLVGFPNYLLGAQYGPMPTRTEPPARRIIR